MHIIGKRLRPKGLFYSNNGTFQNEVEVGKHTGDSCLVITTRLHAVNLIIHLHDILFVGECTEIYVHCLCHWAESALRYHVLAWVLHDRSWDNFLLQPNHLTTTTLTTFFHSFTSTSLFFVFTSSSPFLDHSQQLAPPSPYMSHNMKTNCWFLCTIGRCSTQTGPNSITSKLKRKPEFHKPYLT